MLRRGGTSQRRLTTVLFTDIVASTEHAARLGDHRWRDLVASHHAIVRDRLRHFHGHEVDTAGDGFLATFEQPVAAIECAAAIIDALAAIDLQVRVGIHTGEAEVTGGKVSGMTVHVASRTLDEAAPGEILVTSTVREVTSGGDVTFSDRGVHRFKGLPDEWHVFAATWHPPDVATPSATSREDTARRSRPRALAVSVAAGALALGLLVVVAAAWLAGGAPPALAVVPDSVVTIDPSTDRLTAVLPLSMPTGIAADDSSVWVLSQDDLMTRIDTTSGAATPVGLPGSPSGVAAGDGAAWVILGYGVAGERGGVVLRVGTDGQDRERIPLEDGNGATAIAYGADGAWVVNGVYDSLTRIDPVTRDAVEVAQVGSQPVAVAAGEGAVWVAHGVERSLWRIDPDTLEKTAEITLTDPPTAIAIGFGRVWVTSSTGNTVVVIDATATTRLATILVEQSPRGIAAGGDAIWIACGRGAFVRVDPVSLEATTVLSVPGPADGVAVSGDEVWGTVQT